MDFYQRLLRLEAFLDREIEFGSGGMMRQGQVLGATGFDPAKRATAAGASLRIRERKSMAITRAHRAPLVGGIEEKQALTEANHQKIRNYLAQLARRRLGRGPV